MDEVVRNSQGRDGYVEQFEKNLDLIHQKVEQVVKKKKEGQIMNINNNGSKRLCSSHQKILISKM